MVENYKDMKSRSDFKTEEEYIQYLRTYLSGKAMQGLLPCVQSESFRKGLEFVEKEKGATPTDIIAKMSVEHADALIEALNK